MNVQLRTDLLFYPRESRGQTDWVVKDPLTFQHFLFTDHEMFLLKQLDGQRTEAEIIANWRWRFESSRTPKSENVAEAASRGAGGKNCDWKLQPQALTPNGTLTPTGLRKFVGRLVHDQLVVVNQSGFSHVIYQRAKRDSAVRFSRWLSSPLAIRFRGFNPAPLLSWFDGVGRLLFHPGMIVGVMLSALLVLLFVFGHFESVARRLPAIEQMLSGQGLARLVVTLVLVKLLHELGHALACRRFGGDCFEIGIIFLVGVPTLYCDVSDSWTFAERWKRMVVSFAGMYVEIGLAALAAVGWMLTPPSLLNALLFNVVVLCSVNTLLVNGNPLLRYDGYYLLADWWDRPNLSSTARLAVERFWLSGFLQPQQAHALAPTILVYGLLSLVYRWAVLLAIIVGLAMLMGHWGSYSLGYLLGSLLLVSFLWTAAMGTINSVNSDRWRGFSWWRTAISLLVLLTVGWLISFVPLPTYVYCSAGVEANDPVRIYAANDGRLVSIQESYVSVSAGEEIGRIENVQLLRDRQIKQRSMERAEVELKEMQRRVNREPELAGLIGELQESARTRRQELEMVEQEIAALRLVAPRTGLLLPAESRPVRTLDDVALPRWTGHVNAVENQNCFVNRSEHLMTIVNPDERIVSLVVGESEIELLEVGQAVTVRFELTPANVVFGEIEKILRQEVLLRGADTELESYVDSRGQRHTVQTPYRVEVRCENLSAGVLIGSTGRAKIQVREQTIAERMRRWVAWSLATRD